MDKIEEFARERISKIKVDRSNLDFIANSGKINGSLLLSLVDLSKDISNFAQRWISVEEEYPLAWENGEWDGLRSDFVLVKNQFGDWNKGQLYSGTLDGHQFNDWCDEDGYYFSNITHWRLIEFK